MVNKMDTDIKIRVVTDKKTLSDKGHDAPVIELYNDVIDTWISCKDLSFETIKREILHIQRETDTYIAITRAKNYETNKKFEDILLKNRDVEIQLLKHFGFVPDIK